MFPFFVLYFLPPIPLRATHYKIEYGNARLGTKRASPLAKASDTASLPKCHYGQKSCPTFGALRYRTLDILAQEYRGIE